MDFLSKRTEIYTKISNKNKTLKEIDTKTTNSAEDQAENRLVRVVRNILVSGSVSFYAFDRSNLIIAQDWFIDLLRFRGIFHKNRSI